LLALLTRNDRALLGALYASARARGADLGAVDDVARALIGLRESERTEAEQPVGKASALSTILPEPAVRPEVLARASSPSGAPAGLEQAALEPVEQAVPAEHTGDPFALAIPRSFGSATQMAAKLAGSYASLVPPGDRYRAAPSSRAPAAPSFSGLAHLAWVV
jgi:hypothetical protein